MMLRVLMVVDRAQPAYSGTVIEPARTISTLTDPTNLRFHTLGRFYDVVLLHADAVLNNEHRIMIETVLAPGGIVVPITAA